MAADGAPAADHALLQPAGRFCRLQLFLITGEIDQVPGGHPFVHGDEAARIADQLDPFAGADAEMIPAAGAYKGRLSQVAGKKRTLAALAGHAELLRYGSLASRPASFRLQGNIRLPENTSF